MSLIGIDFDYDNPWYVATQQAEALAARLCGRDPTGPAARFRGTTLRSLARAAVMVDGDRDVGRSDTWCVTEALSHGGSDFKRLLANVADKVMLDGYWSAQPTYRAIARRIEFANFRPHSVVRAPDFPRMLEANEAAEFQYGSLPDSSQTVMMATYGRVVGIERKVLVNDDMDAFAATFRTAGQRVRDVENRIFFEVCMLPNGGLGPALGDGQPVFDAAHSNLAVAGALDAATLGDARAKLRGQTTHDGLTLNTPARYLLVPAASETAAETLVDTLHGAPLTVLADANLTGTRFYVLADPLDLTQYVHGRLLGASAPRVVLRPGFNFDGMEVRVASDFGTAPVDHRGGVTGGGA